MGFLIDTSVWIELERGNLQAADIHAITHQELIFLSPINMAEFRYGIEMIQDHGIKTRALAFLRKMRRKPLLRITGETAEVLQSFPQNWLDPGAVPIFGSRICGSRRKQSREI